MEGSARYFVHQLIVVDDVKRAGEVPAEKPCAKRRLTLVESTSNGGRQRKKRRVRGATRPEAVLRDVGQKSGVEIREEQTLKDFDFGTKETNRSIGFSLVGRFPRLSYGDDGRRPPDRRRLRFLHRQIE